MNFEIATEGLHQGSGFQARDALSPQLPPRSFLLRLHLLLETPRMMTRKSTVGPPN